MDTELVTSLIKFNAQTNGRDKLCRLFQYGCRMVWGHLQRSGNATETIQKLKNIEYMFSMTRKLLRFGKSLDFIQGALKSLHLKDVVLRLTITLSKINQAFYLLFDHFLWFNNVGAIKLNKQYWSELSSRFYLATLMLNLVRDFYDIWNLLVKELNKSAARKKSSPYINGDSNYHTLPKKERTLAYIIEQNRTLFLETAKNLFDLSIPMSTLGYIKLSPRTQGIMGLISSAIAAATVWNPTLKLVPS